MAIRKNQYELIKSFIHMSMVPMSVKQLWLKDKEFKKWWVSEIKKDFAKTQYDKIK